MYINNNLVDFQIFDIKFIVAIEIELIVLLVCTFIVIFNTKFKLDISFVCTFVALEICNFLNNEFNDFNNFNLYLTKSQAYNFDSIFEYDDLLLICLTISSIVFQVFIKRYFNRYLSYIALQLNFVSNQEIKYEKNSIDNKDLRCSRAKRETYLHKL